MLVGALVLSLILLGVAFVVIVRLRKARGVSPRAKHQPILPGGGAVPEDLTKDAFTDDQRYLM